MRCVVCLTKDKIQPAVTVYQGFALCDSHVKQAMKQSKEKLW